MKVKAGKHAGKLTEQLVLKFPDYVQWYTDNLPASAVAKELERHISVLDGKPFVVKCYTCGKQAKRASAYEGSSSLYFWCASCDPYGSGANQGKLRVVKRYVEALHHLDLTASGSVLEKRAMIKELAQAKGLPARVGDEQATKFFS